MTALTAHGYRADIDGIRAIAVLLVVLFHAYPSSLAGGYAGVDMFFVISGYLITAGIYQQLQAGVFRFRVFYERRIRRIFPALSVVLLTVLMFGWFGLLQEDYKRLGYHGAWGSVFLLNFVYWGELGYFDLASEKKPLLHLWSLGVEEQFYLLAPLLMWGIYRWRARFTLSALVVFFFASLAVYVSLNVNEAQSAFYLPHARFWQLLAGAILAVWQHKRVSATSRWFGKFHLVAEVAPVLAVCVLAVFLNRVQKGWDTYLGTIALLPVACTLIWLMSANSHFNRHVLSASPLTFVGRISYPLYLWHWVLFSFGHLFYDAKPFHEIRLPALVASFVLAWLTYRYVETPIRFQRYKNCHVVFLVAPLLVVLVWASAVFLLNGVPSREAASVQRVNAGDYGQATFQADMAAHYGVCAQGGLMKTKVQGVVQSRCASRIVDVTAPGYWLIGDSHAEHLMTGLTQAYPHVNLTYATREGWPFLSDAQYGEEIKTLVQSKPKPQGVLIAMHWSSKLRSVQPDPFLAELKQTLAYLLAHQVEVVLFDDLPIFPFNAERCAYADRLWITHRCEANGDEVEKNKINFSPMVNELQSTYKGLTYIDLSRYVCDSQVCSMARDGQLLYRDRNHLNIPGSAYIGRAVQAEYPDLFTRKSF